MATDRPRDGLGSGLVATMFGALIFLSFLALATHVLIGLYANSVTTSVAWDAARSVATSDDPTSPSVQAAAEQKARQKLSSLRDVSFVWKFDDAGVTGLEVTARRPVLLPKAMAEHMRLTQIHRTVWVRQGTLR